MDNDTGKVGDPRCIFVTSFRGDGALERYNNPRGVINAQLLLIRALSRGLVHDDLKIIFFAYSLSYSLHVIVYCWIIFQFPSNTHLLFLSL